MFEGLFQHLEVGAQRGIPIDLGAVFSNSAFQFATVRDRDELSMVRVEGKAFKHCTLNECSVTFDLCPDIASLFERLNLRRQVTIGKTAIRNRVVGGIVGRIDLECRDMSGSAFKCEHFAPGAGQVVAFVFVRHICSVSWVLVLVI